MYYKVRSAGAVVLLILSAGRALATDDVLAHVAAHADRFGAISRQIWENRNSGITRTRALRFYSGNFEPMASKFRRA